MSKKRKKVLNKIVKKQVHEHFNENGWGKKGSPYYGFKICNGGLK